MFLENKYAKPLFDFEKGGKPRAFLCLLAKPNDILLDCGKVTRTERGMRMHLKTVHGWEEQSCLSLTDHQTGQQIEVGSAEYRKTLRVSPAPSRKEVEKPTEKIQRRVQKSQETSEGELLKLMKGGN